MQLIIAQWILLSFIYIKQIYSSILDGLVKFLFFGFSFEYLTETFINK